MATKKFSPAQLAAQKLFAERARAGTLGKGKRKVNPVKKNPVEGKSIFNLGGGYFGSVTMSGYNEYYAEVFYRTTDSSGSTDNQIVPDYKPRYFVSAKSAVSSLMRYKTKNLGRKTNPVTETLIYGLAPGETRDYMEELMYAGGQKLTQAQIDKVFKAASDAGYHSFRVAGFDPTMKPDFAAAVRRKRNPDKTKPRAYVRRASQITGAPPSKRLVSRRKMALKAPAGYFPNPKTAPMVVGYQVICMHPKKHVIGVFKTMPQAKEMAKALADYGGVPYAIKKVKIHKTHFMVHDFAIM